MGADERLFYKQKEAFGLEIELISFIPPQDDETFSQYAQRFARTVLDHRAPDSYHLGGISFGVGIFYIFSRFYF